VIFQEGLDTVDASNVRFYEGLGRAQLQAGKPEEAIQAFTRGRALDPRRAALASGLGWACWNLKRYGQSKRAWEDAIKLDPEFEDAWSALAWVYMATGEFEKSQAGFVILLRKDPERRAWILGLTMARAHNSSIDQIRAQFKGMPDPAAFTAPASRPAP
jgi:tetratricopeptide (TPR) repeat protein